MDKQRRRAQSGEVLGAELFRFARRVQRIREQQQGMGDGRVLGSEKRSLPPPVRVPAQYDEPRRDLTHCFGGALQPFAIARGRPGKRGAGRTHLAIRKIAAQNVKSCAGEFFRHRAQ